MMRLANPAEICLKPVQDSRGDLRAHHLKHFGNSGNECSRDLFCAQMRAQQVITVAGGKLGGEGDKGSATDAGLDRPHGCDIDSNGNIFIADSNNHRIRVVGA